MTRPLPPRTEHPRPSPERRALQDVLAWPIVTLLLTGAAVAFVLPRFVPQRFLALAVGGVVATLTIALVGVLAWVVERWLLRTASAAAAQAEREVLVSEAGVPTVTTTGPLAPLAAAFADAGGRAARRSADREFANTLAQFGADAANAVTSASAFGSVPQYAESLRALTAPVPAAMDTVDVIQTLRELVTDIDPVGDEAVVQLVCETERAIVRIDAGHLASQLLHVLTLARAASPDGSTITVHASRIFRAAVEDTPVRRTSDSPRTIVPRAPSDVLQNWVLQAQPGAELLSIVVTDGGPAPDTVSAQRAFDPFAAPRPGDRFGVLLATVRRAVRDAGGTMWMDGAREGGNAIHILLPIASN